MSRYRIILKPKTFSYYWRVLERPYPILTDRKYIVRFHPIPCPPMIIKRKFIFGKVVKRHPPLFEEFIREFEGDWFVSRRARGGKRVYIDNEDKNGKDRNGKSNDDDDDDEDVDGDKKLEYYVALNLQYFKPEDITVKVSGDIVIVEGKYIKKDRDNGLLSMHFIQKYLIPEQCDPSKVTSTLSSDGLLMIMAPKKARVTLDKRERIIAIEHTGKPAEYQIHLDKFKLHK